MKNTKYHIIFIFTATAIILFGACKKSSIITPPPPVHSDTAPNIILILGDDVGYEIPTINGGQSYSTPYIDKMANAGMRFTQCYGAPTCSPSRFMILTGKYNFRNYDKSGVLDLRQRTIANMLHDAGYATCVAGKWQLDGGDLSIRTFGFDRYSVFQAFDSEVDKRYKDPFVYQEKEYLPSSQTLGKYGEDIYADFIMNFMDSVSKKKKPFFVYYSMALSHNPFSPTPDDPEFETWDPLASSNPVFFPSMVKYMDKKIGTIIEKVKDLGIENNTLIIFMGDNGTPNEIYSLLNGKLIQGGKGLTTEYGTHVPLIAYWPGKILPGINNDLIDFTDLLPTFAELTGIPKPAFGRLDGVSFSSTLTGGTGKPRTWIFCHYIHQGGQVTRYVQNNIYKLYDITGDFFNTQNDIEEKHPLSFASLNSEQRAIRDLFLNVLAMEQ